MYWHLLGTDEDSQGSNLQSFSAHIKRNPLVDEGMQGHKKCLESVSPYSKSL